MSVPMIRFVVVASAAVFCTRADKLVLPSVDTVLTKADSKAHDFAEQAAAMQKKLAEQQEKSRAALRTQKEEYEHLLQAQSNRSQAISKEVDELKSGNFKITQMNTETLTGLRALAQQNDDLRSTLQSIMSKASAAKLFVADSLKVTDDSKAQELEVLTPTTPKPTLNNFLAATSGKTLSAATSGKTLSLLALHSTRRTNGAQEMVSLLNDSLAEIAEAEKEAVADLKASFMQHFREGEQHQAELNETRASLEQAQADLKEYRAKLMKAKAHLEATSKSLHERLRAVRTFAATVTGNVGASLNIKVEKGSVSAPVVANVRTAANVSTNASKLNATPVQKPRPMPAVLVKTNTSILINASLVRANATNATKVAPAMAAEATENRQEVVKPSHEASAKDTLIGWLSKLR